MTQKMAFFLSAVLSTFVLAMIAGVGSFLAGGNETTEAVFSQQDVAQLIAERDAAYEQMINEANRQLSEAQALLDGEIINTSAEEENNLLPPELAGLMASQMAVGNSTPLADAELVDFEGSVAYEVPFSAGNIYIDAENGDLLFNGTITLSPRVISQQEAAAIAAAYMEGTKIYKVELFTLNGEEVYRVKFVNSDAVFVSQYGQILLVRLAPDEQSASVSDSSEHHDDDDDDHEDEEDEEDEHDD